MAVAARKPVECMRLSPRCGFLWSNTVTLVLRVSMTLAQSSIVPVGAEEREQTANGGFPPKLGNQKFVRALIPPWPRGYFPSAECSNEQSMVSDASGKSTVDQ